MRYSYVELGVPFRSAWYINADNPSEALQLLAERYAMYYGLDSSLPPGALIEVSPVLSSFDCSESRLISVYKKHINLKKILKK